MCRNVSLNERYTNDPHLIKDDRGSFDSHAKREHRLMSGALFGGNTVHNNVTAAKRII